VCLPSLDRCKMSALGDTPALGVGIGRCPGAHTDRDQLVLLAGVRTPTGCPGGDGRSLWLRAFRLVFVGMMGWSPAPVQYAGAALAASVKTRTGGAGARARVRGERSDLYPCGGSRLR